jgi:2-polyprenyl-6-methoxyphenol hydroxylase-like FAD-dependent oxidoreductase
VNRIHDAVVVGGGPAGLAFAIAAAARGLDVIVLERRVGPLDKACGEGVLPAGVRALEALGVLPALRAEDTAPFREIRWCESDGAAARLGLPAPGGLGIRRTALVDALRARAAASGVELRTGAEVIAHARAPGHASAELAGGEAVRARILVAADGLGSPTRRREGLDRRVASPPRFGIRQHFAVPPWADAVEVHFADGAEAYVTPAGARRVGVAILFERSGRVRFEDLVERFPALATVLRAAPADSAVRGAGPLARRAAARVADRLVLLGDAAGYLDAVTGDGLSLAFACALDLAAILPAALARGAGAAALAPYEAAWRRRYRPYAAWTRLVLGLARHPALRRRVLRLAAARPRPFERVVAAAVG